MTMIGGPDGTTALLMQFLQMPLDEKSRAGGILSRFLQGREWVSEGLPALPLALGANELRDAQDAQTLARRVLTAVAENLPLRTHDLAEIEAGAQRFDRRLGYTHAHITVTDVSGELALLTEAVLPQTVFLAHDGLPVQRLLADVFRELKYALGAHLAFRVCAVCGLLHRDDRYTPHLCVGPPARLGGQEASPLFQPIPRTAADEPGAEVPEEETIYGVISDPTPIGVVAVAEPAAAHNGPWERHAASNGGVHYAASQPSIELPPPVPKPLQRADGSPTLAKRNGRSGKEEKASNNTRHPGAAYWEDEKKSHEPHA